MEARRSDVDKHLGSAEKPFRPDIALRTYAPDDRELLGALLGDVEMTRYLGGPESEAALDARHLRYLESDPATNGIFTILAGPDKASVGWIGYWETEWEGEPGWECGWHVLQTFQRQGVATAAARLALESVCARRRHRWIDAFPSLSNAASNALCRRLGFTSLGEVAFEYPKGHMMSGHHWRYDLLEEFA